MTAIPKRKRKYRIDINQRWCKGCYICLEICPKKVFDNSGEVTRRGFRQIRTALPGQCTGCLLCELLCPDVAIRITQKDGIPDEKED
ncbi:ferredoxin family protein [Acidobacteriota bacterium]